MRCLSAEPAVRTESDRGQTLPLLAVVMLFVALVCMGVTRVGGVLADRAKARTAADAAALAGVDRGEDEAAAVAVADGATLEAYESRRGEVEVTVRVGDERARARARRSWPSP